MNVRMGAELPAIVDAAKMDFLLDGVMNPIISLIFTLPATLGVGRDGNSISNAVLAATPVVIAISSVRSTTPELAENTTAPATFSIILMLLLLKLSNSYGKIRYK